jgi:plasmid replication initiation protein
MVRKNGKRQIISYEDSIKKSNEFSMSKLNKGLTLNQMQLLAYAIFSTQQNGETEFIKADFEKKFSIEYKTSFAEEDSQRLLDLKFSIVDLENDKFVYWNVFQKIQYDNGTFTFKWTDDMIPHILELKEKYVTTDLTITAKFKSGFSWSLYDYLKAHYGFWHKPVSKLALMKLFGVENRKTYQNNTGRFRKSVLDVAIGEINQYTELNVCYEVEKKGRAIVGFDLIWSTGTNQKSATKKQIKELRIIVDTVLKDMFKFVDLDNKDHRQQAIQMINDIHDMKIYTEEPICITYKKADELIQNANMKLRDLNLLLPRDSVKRDTSFYYNWLDEGK